jgi:hypothetical protein
MSVFFFLLRIVVLAGFVFFFTVLFQYGPSGLAVGFREEAAALRSLLPSAGEADKKEDSSEQAASTPVES